MNLFQLEYFVKLAETLNYTKASQQLHISQPTLSNWIFNLEQSLGTQLFIRNKRDVKLTPAGKVFYTEVKKTLTIYENSIHKVRNLDSGITTIINVGIVGTALLHKFPMIMRNCRQKYPDIKINPFDYSYDSLISKLHNNELDIAIFPDFVSTPYAGIVKQTIFSDSVCVVMHESNQLASKSSLTLEMIKDEPLINMNPKYSKTDFDIINNIFKTAKLYPNTVYEASSLLNMMLMADCEVGITILAKHMRQFATSTLCFVPLEGFESYFRVSFAYKDTANESIDKILDLIKDTLKSSPDNVEN